jgi:hypothetical protein
VVRHRISSGSHIGVIDGREMNDYEDMASLNAMTIIKFNANNGSKTKKTDRHRYGRNDTVAQLVRWMAMAWTTGPQYSLGSAIFSVRCLVQIGSEAHKSGGSLSA